MTTVLVADDSRAAREILIALLRSSNFQVVEACDGREAKQLIEANRLDLVMTDVVMPEMNGYELCRWIKQHAALLPVIFCSVKGEAFDRHWGHKQGCDAYICKPFESDLVLRTIHQVLQGPGKAS
ncbi:response regulator transcription factor [Lyngbya confervoides]|uniref:Response regulator n=1 Tax=Lyngbya confervoides BDU141951 TaxID=1574623 RepID=A0ABD4T7M7_9CYAN|nr:response regulator [Lyngbya confervoides]MCM1984782.1 response regulator [Lyngbya confervoides BDU141951]